MSDKHKVEAILFTTGRFMGLEEIAKVCEIGSVGYVKDLLEELKKDYEQRDSALTLVHQDDMVKLNIKKDYGYLANKLMADSEMDSPTTKTLAVIAYKQPVLQHEIIKIRGNKAYDHIKILKEQNLIITEKQGRSRLIKLTPQFYNYFDTAAEEVKEQFKNIKIPESLQNQHSASEAQPPAAPEPTPQASIPESSPPVEQQPSAVPETLQQESLPAENLDETTSSD
ncbi:SMC-Scp complex subunit ScpB [Candidatus Woesearchaeota archaeon]|nr:SMC-Scp complex subunit ScpB [Candidatus Woesearchaeota archaeon]